MAHILCFRVSAVIFREEAFFSLGAEKNRFKFSFVPTTITFFNYVICGFLALCFMCVIYAADYKSNAPLGDNKACLDLESHLNLKHCMSCMLHKQTTRGPQTHHLNADAVNFRLN